MAVVIMVDVPNETSAQYDAVTAEMGFTDTLPQGCKTRIAGAGPDGSWRVISVWDDMDTAGAFVTTTLRQAYEKVGVAPPNSPPVTWTVHDLVV